MNHRGILKLVLINADSRLNESLKLIFGNYFQEITIFFTVESFLHASNAYDVVVIHENVLKNLIDKQIQLKFSKTVRLHKSNSYIVSNQFNKSLFQNYFYQGYSGIIDYHTFFSCFKHILSCKPSLSNDFYISPNFLESYLFQILEIELLLDSAFTKQEQKVVKHLIEGKSYIEIAKSCTISINTLRMYIKIIYGKLELNSKTKIQVLFENPELLILILKTIKLKNSLHKIRFNIVEQYINETYNRFTIEDLVKKFAISHKNAHKSLLNFREKIERKRKVQIEISHSEALLKIKMKAVFI